MLNSRFGYSMKKNSFKGLNIDCIQYSNNIRITYWTNWNCGSPIDENNLIRTLQNANRIPISRNRGASCKECNSKSKIELPEEYSHEIWTWTGQKNQRDDPKRGDWWLMAKEDMEKFDIDEKALKEKNKKSSKRIHKKENIFQDFWKSERHPKNTL